MDLTGIKNQSEEEYIHQSDIQSIVESLENIDDEESATSTKIPVHPESEETEFEQTVTVRHSRDSLSSRYQSFPYQSRTIIDDRLRELTLKYEIQEELGQRLRALEDYEIILLCDDSGSMITPIDNTNHTRWDELNNFVKIILEIGIIFDSTGIDIYFLNRRPIYNVTDPNSVDEIFSIPPRGYTPMVNALKYIFQLPITRRGNDKKVLVFIITDGEPTDDKGNININDLEHLMINQRQSETTHVMFLTCNDDPTYINYLDQWDTNMINVDVTNHFKAERDKIRKFRGHQYPFSKGDYIVKALIGAIDQQMDNINESNH